MLVPPPAASSAYAGDSCTLPCCHRIEDLAQPALKAQGMPNTRPSNYYKANSPQTAYARIPPLPLPGTPLPGTPLIRKKAEEQYNNEYNKL